MNIYFRNLWSRCTNNSHSLFESKLITIRIHLAFVQYCKVYFHLISKPLNEIFLKIPYHVIRDISEYYIFLIFNRKVNASSNLHLDNRFSLSNNNLLKQPSDVNNKQVTAIQSLIKLFVPFKQPQLCSEFFR